MVILGYIGDTGIYWWYWDILVILGYIGDTGICWWCWDILVILRYFGDSGIYWWYWNILMILGCTSDIRYILGILGYICLVSHFKHEFEKKSFLILQMMVTGKIGWTGLHAVWAVALANRHENVNAFYRATTENLALAIRVKNINMRL